MYSFFGAHNNCAYPNYEVVKSFTAGSRPESISSDHFKDNLVRQICRGLQENIFDNFVEESTNLWKNREQK